MEQGIKKLVLGDCEVIDAGCQVIADIAKVNDPLEELDLPKNTKSCMKFKITITRPLKRLRKRRGP